MDSQIVQDLLPGTGSIGSVPMHHDYKRAIIRSAPKEFTVEVLPPKKFGSGYCYGMHIVPIVSEGGDSRSLKSTKTGSSINTEYEVWRRWEDCLWFQDLLETEYKLMSRTKRTRLAQGKGVKKDGMYIRSDQAASFESLPPGPDVHDIAKDVHDILPKLTKKGTLFRAGQATIEQRGREFSALVNAFFREDIPTLVRELHDNRVIRDFFGYWRRDKDHDRKASEQPTSSRMSRVSITSSAFSMYFSSSNISLSLPGAFSDVPPSPSLPASVKNSARKGKGKQITKAASFVSSSSSSSRSSGSSHSSHSPRTPVSAPAGMSFTVDAAGSLIPTSPMAHDNPHSQRAGPSSAPLRSYSSQWSLGSRKAAPIELSVSEGEEGDIVFVPEPPWVESFDLGRTSGLQPLPEDQEFVPAMTRMSLSGPSSPPIRRTRNYSCPDPTNRNGLFLPPPLQDTVLVESDTASSTDGHTPDRPSTDAAPDTPLTQTDSSCRSSVALTSFSNQSRRSSWRTSVASLSDIPTDLVDAEVDLDDFLSTSPDMMDSAWPPDDNMMKSSHRLRPSVATINSIMTNSSVDAVLPRRSSSPPLTVSEPRRPFSAGSRRSAAISPTQSITESELWEEQQDDLISAYFYDPGLRPATPPPLSGQVTPMRERASTIQISTPDRFPKPFQNRPPGQFHLPWMPVNSPRMSVVSLSPSTADTFTIKAVRQDTIVLLRATYSMPLLEVRNKIRAKFSSQDCPPLTDAFTVGFAPTESDEAGQVTVLGRPRSQSTSAIRPNGRPRLRFISTEEDWHSAISTCTGKLTLHIFDRF